jgi:hypothetical protein
MVKPATLYSATSGLNTVLDPERLTMGTRDNPGMIELSQAVNVSIDDRGLISLRNGSEMKQAGAFHSLFCDKGDCFVVQDRAGDSAIFRVGEDFGLTGVRSGLSKGRPMSFTDTGEATFYANGVENGFIAGGVSSVWPIGTYSGPDTNYSFTSAPVGNHIAFKRGGLMLIAVGAILWINHLPYNFGLYNLRSGFVSFPSAIRMICPMESGVFISDQTRTYFLRGTSWFDFVQVAAADYPALEWSLATDVVKLKDIGMDMPGEGRIWASTEGICLGMEDGTVTNLTRRKIEYPKGHVQGACLIKDTKVIHTVF